MSSDIAAERLRSVVHRIERLEEEKEEVADQISQTIKAVIKRRKLPSAARSEQDELLAL